MIGWKRTCIGTIISIIIIFGSILLFRSFSSIRLMLLLLYRLSIFFLNSGTFFCSCAGLFKFFLRLFLIRGTYDVHQCQFKGDPLIIRVLVLVIALIGDIDALDQKVRRK